MDTATPPETAAHQTEERKFARQAAKNIEPDKIAPEPGLYMMKWFDYRFISPVEATNRFADAYRQVYRQAWRSYMGIEEAPHKQGIAAGDVFAHRDRRGLVGLWTARQMADVIGVPYRFYIWHGIEYLLSGRSRHIPRPNQLVNRELAGDVEKRWAEHCTGRLFYSKNPRYLNVNFCGDRAQIDHREWLIKQIKLRERAERRHLITALCFEAGYVPLDLIKAHFDPELISEALAEASVIISGAPATLLFRPGCHGTPHAYQPSVEECAHCVHSATCALEVNAVLADLKRIYGTVEPLKEHKRQLNRVRQRRSRAKKKALAAGLPLPSAPSTRRSRPIMPMPRKPS